MSNVVKESLQENSEEILKALPTELHDEFKKSIESVEPTPRLSTEEAKEQAAALMKADPTIAHEECIPLVENDAMINQAIQQPCDAELELQKQAALKEIEATLPAE